MATQTMQHPSTFDRLGQNPRSQSSHDIMPPLDSKALYDMYGEQAGLSRPPIFKSQGNGRADDDSTCLGRQFGRLDVSTSKGLVDKILGRSPELLDSKVPAVECEAPHDRSLPEAVTNDEELSSYLDRFQQATEELSQRIKSTSHVMAARQIS